MAGEFKCRHCGSNCPGPPAGLIPRANGSVPVCGDCVLRYMPSRRELEQFWLRYMRATAAAQ